MRFLVWITLCLSQATFVTSDANNKQLSQTTTVAKAYVDIECWAEESYRFMFVKVDTTESRNIADCDVEVKSCHLVDPSKDTSTYTIQSTSLGWSLRVHTVSEDVYGTYQCIPIGNSPSKSIGNTTTAPQSTGATTSASQSTGATTTASQSTGATTTAPQSTGATTTASQSTGATTTAMQATGATTTASQSTGETTTRQNVAFSQESSDHGGNSYPILVLLLVVCGCILIAVSFPYARDYFKKIRRKQQQHSCEIEDSGSEDKNDWFASEPLHYLEPLLYCRHDEHVQRCRPSETRCQGSPSPRADRCRYHSADGPSYDGVPWPKLVSLVSANWAPVPVMTEHP